MAAPPQPATIVAVTAAAAGSSSSSSAAPAALAARRPFVAKQHTALVACPPSVACRVVGHVRSAFTQRFGTPRQPFADRNPARGGGGGGGGGGDEEGDAPAATVVLDGLARAEAAQCLRDLEQFSHCHLLTFFHMNTGYAPLVRAPGAAARHGVFATRSPHRPNSLGLSTVRVLRVDHARGELHFAGCDLLDGTGVLDIKPYVPYCDRVPGANSGWLRHGDAASAAAAAACVAASEGAGADEGPEDGAEAEARAGDGDGAADADEDADADVGVEEPGATPRERQLLSLLAARDAQLDAREAELAAREAELAALGARLAASEAAQRAPPAGRPPSA